MLAFEMVRPTWATSTRANSDDNKDNAGWNRFLRLQDDSTAQFRRWWLDLFDASV